LVLVENPEAVVRLRLNVVEHRDGRVKIRREKFPKGAIETADGRLDSQTPRSGDERLTVPALRGSDAAV
jgi:hypothetical protein